MATIIPIGDIWFQLTLILAIAVLSHFLISRFRQPMVMGEILIGIILGPTIVGYVLGCAFYSPGDIVLLFDLQTTQLLASIGAIVLLFIIGLECDIREIYTRRSAAIALGGVIVPWILGYFFALYLLPPSVTAGFPATAIFVGVALVATSVAVTATILAEMNLLESSVAKMILGAAVVDDILGMVILSISSGVTGGDILLFGYSVDIGLYALYLIVISTLFIILGAFLGSRHVCRLVGYVHARAEARNIRHAGFLVALGITFLYAFISESIGISAIVGAFVAGTVFSGNPLKKELKKGAGYLSAVFVPIFFISLGLLVDFSGLYGAHNDLVFYLIFGIGLTAAAMVSKVIGCGIPARLMGASAKESVAIGIGMTPRLEVALIIAVYALSQAIIHTYVYSVIVLMGVLTALVTPPILRRALAWEKSPEEKVKSPGAMESRET